MAGELFTEAERERIRQAVVAAEANTSGEIATVVVAGSDRYPEAEVLGGVLLAALLALIASIIFHHGQIWFYLPLTFLLYFPCFAFLRKVPAMKLALVSRPRRDQAVRDCAVRSFYEKGLHRTRNETGVLIFISRLERKVWILGDRGIDSRISPEGWQKLASTLSRGIREGRACDALCAIIAQCGEELARHFPRQTDDANELSDEVLD